MLLCWLGKRLVRAQNVISDVRIQSQKGTRYCGHPNMVTAVSFTSGNRRRRGQDKKWCRTELPLGEVVQIAPTFSTLAIDTRYLGGNVLTL
jgi:hypothetical protein